MAEGAIEGAIKGTANEYIVDSKFATAIKCSRFETSALRVRTGAFGSLPSAIRDWVRHMGVRHMGETIGALFCKKILKVFTVNVESL